jgi:hypothetical protein
MQNIRKIILGRWFWLIALAVFFISRVSTFLFPFDSDHWIFYYIGRRWIDGATLYIDMWDHKSPLIYGYNGLLHAVFGGNIYLHRIVFTIVALIGLWLFYKTAQKLLYLFKIPNREFVVRVSTLLFAFLANLSQFTNSGNNNENLGLVFILAALYCYLIYRQNTKKYELQLLLSGIAAGFVFILKANFAVLLLPMLIDLIIINRKNIFRLISSIAIFAFGTLLHLLIWALYFKHVGTFKQFFIATFEFNSKYIKALGWDIHAPDIKVFIGILVVLLLFFLPFLLRALADFKRPDSNKLLVPMFAASTLFFMVLAGTFYSHYFLIIIPYLCLIFAATASKVFKRHRALKMVVPLIIIIFMFMISLKLGVYNSFYGSAAQELKNEKLAAQYIKDHTNANDKIFANLYGATFYRLSNRDSGSRYISASHPLIDYKYKFGYDFNRTFIFDMEDSEAKYVVMLSDKNDIYRVQNPVLMRYFARNYHLEKIISGYDIYRRNNT